MNKAKDSRPLANKRLLLVDNYPDPDRLTLQHLLAEGAHVTLECHALAATQVVLAVPEGFDAVIIDLELPESDCLQAASMLRLAGYARLLVAIGTFSTEEKRQRLLLAGFDAVLLNATSSAYFIETIGRLLKEPGSASS